MNIVIVLHYKQRNLLAYVSIEEIIMIQHFHGDKLSQRKKRSVCIFLALRFSTFVICHLVRIARLGINKEVLIIKESRDGLRELEYMWGGRVCLPICLTKSPQRLRIMNCDVKILSKFKEMRRKQTAPPASTPRYLIQE